MADILDLLDLDEAKQAISSKTTTVKNDEVLARHITAVSGIIDDECGAVVRRTVTAEEHDGGLSIVQLYWRPVTSITLVREDRGGSVETLTAESFGSSGDGYRAPKWERDPALLSGSLHRSGYGCATPWRRVEVTYVAGRVADTASVPARFKDAAGAVLRRLWKREAGAWAQSPEAWEGLDADAGTGFFRVAKPVIDEMLKDDRMPRLKLFVP